MDYINGYDEKDPLSIERYAQQLVGKTFEEVCEADMAKVSSVGLC